MAHEYDAKQWLQQRITSQIRSNRSDEEPMFVFRRNLMESMPVFPRDGWKVARDWIKRFNHRDVENQWALMSVYDNDRYIKTSQLKKTKAYVKSLPTRTTLERNGKTWLKSQIQKQIRARK